MREKYIGALDRNQMTKEVVKAYECYCASRKRAKRLGLGHCLDPREFIIWYVNEQKKLKLKYPSINRFNHEKGYVWGNFNLDECSNNSRESAIRNNLRRFADAKSKKINILNPKNGKFIMTVPSIMEAERITGVARINIRLHLKNKVKKPRHFGFKYAEIKK